MQLETWYVHGLKMVNGQYDTTTLGPFTTISEALQIRSNVKEQYALTEVNQNHFMKAPTLV